jgi:hypothetical protein
MDERRIREMQERMVRNKRGMGVALLVGGVGGMFLPIPFGMWVGGAIAGIGALTVASTFGKST